MAELATPGERGLPADSNAGSPSPQPNNASELGATFVPVAWVRSAEDGGTVVRPDGSTAALEKGLPLFAGDVIETGEGGTVVVALAGGSGFALGEGARVVLGERDGDAGADLVVLRGAAVVIADPDGGADGPLVAMLAMTLQLDGPNASVFLQQAGPESLVTLLPGGGPGASAAAYNQAGVAALDTPYATLATSSVSDPPDSAPRPSVETIALLFSQAAVPDAGSAQSTEAGGTDLTPVGETLAEIAPAAGDPAFSPDGPFVLASELDLGELFGRVSAIELDAPVFQSAAVTRAARPAHRSEPVPTATSADAPPNAEPEVASPLADVTVDEDAPDTAIDLGASFTDLEDPALTSTALTYSLESNSNPALFADAAIAGGTLTLAYAADANGTADLTIRATDTQGAFVEDAFTVTVNAVNDPPTVAVALADVTADEDAADTAIDLGASFSDVDDATLTYTVESNSNPGLLGSATVAGGTLSLTNAVNASGTADLTIRGTDSAGAFVEDAFSVTVNPIADAPTLTVSAAAGDQDTAIPLSVSAALTDTDGSESLAIEISGVPSGAALSAGTDAGGGVWSLASGDLAGLTLTPPAGDDADFTLTVTARAAETSGGDSAATVGAIPVTVRGPLFSAGDDTVDFNALSDGAYIAGTQYDSLGGNDEVTLSADAAAASAAGYDTSQTFLAGDGDDVITGGSLADSIDGGAGNDTIDGGGGADTLDGGTGDDTFLYEEGDGDDTIDGGADSDALQLSGAGGGALTDGWSLTLNTGELASLQSGALGLADGSAGTVNLAGGETVAFSALETIQWTGPDPKLTRTGTGGRDLLAGLGGDDSLDGLGGDDVLLGRAGGDSLLGQGGDDVLLGGDGVDTLDGGSNEDYVAGGAGNDSLIGDASTDVLLGDGGDDTLDGGGGRDVLAGGVGDDTLIGGGAQNLLLGDAGNDTLQGDTSEDDLIGGDGDDVLTGSNNDDQLFGGAGNDQLDGGNNDDLLDGGAGDDTVVGGSGADVYLFREGSGTDSFSGDSGTDTIHLAAADGGPPTGGLPTAGNGLTLTSGSINSQSADLIVFNGSAAGTIELADGSTLAFDGVERISIEDSIVFAGDDPYFAQAGGDTVSGSGGEDVLIGGSGDDTLSGQNGDDALHGNGGDDTLNGEGGRDYLDGGDGDDALDGGASTDKLVGGAGDDTLSGDAGLDILLGGDGDDTLDGGNSADFLAGGGGDDVLIGGTGKDVLDGGDGIDTADYGTSTTRVTVDLANEGWQNTRAGWDTLINIENLAGSGFNDTLTGDDGANVITGRDGVDTLSGGAGADTLFGGHGVDSLTGDEGADTFHYGAVSDGTAASDGEVGLTTGDQITDFSADDRITIQNAAFGFGAFTGALTEGVSFFSVADYDGTNSGAAAGTAHFVYDSNAETLYYDVDSSADGYTVVATVQPGATITADGIEVVATNP